VAQVRSSTYLLKDTPQRSVWLTGCGSQLPLTWEIGAYIEIGIGRSNVFTLMLESCSRKFRESQSSVACHAAAPSRIWNRHLAPQRFEQSNHLRALIASFQ
jgi:hypothetical protein